MKLLATLLLSCSAIAAQSATDLRTRYGQPISETFRARPDVEMTVTYGKTGTACIFVLEPVYAYLGAVKLDETDTFIKMSVVNEIFDQLVPKNARGSLVSGPRHGHTEWLYKNVLLIVDGNMDRARRAAIAFQGAPCK
ncbi:MAG TPA: hypothetical protein VJV03_10125 [Pyrinomonadaceae bacterium]|nr:hypothetical protein [Pyrinomonadaceae bacterium]